MRRATGHTSERGAALITALMIVSVMAVASLLVIDTVRQSARLTTNLAHREQARLFALGAETLASATIRSMRQVQSERFRALDEQVRTPIMFPIEGGTLQARLSDGSNCFNLNGLVEPAERDALVQQPDQLELYSALLVEIGLSDNQADNLAFATADWIDSDDIAGFGGAEDPFYLGLRPGYRTPGQFIADVSELYLIRGYTAELVDRLRPLICARQTHEPSRLNINTIEEIHLPLLATFLGSEFDVLSASEVLAERPVSGFDSVEEMFALPILSQFQFIDGEGDRFGVASDIYDLFVRVEYHQTVVGLNSVLSVSDTGDVLTEMRRYGAPQ